MSIIEEIRNRNSSTLDAAKELGRGLMLGNASQFKLGYSNRNAALSAIDAYRLDGGQVDEIEFYLLGYSHGLNETPADKQAADFDKTAARRHMTGNVPAEVCDAYDQGRELGDNERRWNPKAYPAATD